MRGFLARVECFVVRKLTLNVEPEVIAMARQLAEKQGISVSEVFSRIVRSMASSHRSIPKLAPKTKPAIGLIKLPTGKTDRELIEEAMADRHLT
jgi:hypothetical protein